MTDEHLIKSADLIGQTIADSVGGKLGTIREVYLDRRDGRAVFAIVDAGGIFGGGGKFHPVPWRLVRFDEVADTFAAALTKEGLKAAPSYDRDQLNSVGQGWGDQTERFFAKP